ncbi:hypothetical protein HYPSUDRAFT_207435 [Hypholoma sublateritium FD-334 SS-4]|uniref:Uncharacterized protein n=1 Tax=Hypholoma sublateritium (strain FD-334 SS-4) TaxID=945553 RepID=A0A0D2P687_HYPSF|nr:hypothetical protein HYPSUDRAFT_207435 [Hypholoma sublateritium FD-334 SS-4]
MPMPAPASAKQKRAPIPLDLTHPVSRNTVAAGVFKALIGSNAERKWRSVRSRHHSHEIFEHSRRTSMDDDHVAVIVRPSCLTLVRGEVDELRDVRLDRLRELAREEVLVDGFVIPAPHIVLCARPPHPPASHVPRCFADIPTPDSRPSTPFKTVNDELQQMHMVRRAVSFNPAVAVSLSLIRRWRLPLAPVPPAPLRDLAPPPGQATSRLLVPACAARVFRLPPHQSASPTSPLGSRLSPRRAIDDHIRFTDS